MTSYGEWSIEKLSVDLLLGLKFINLILSTSFIHFPYDKIFGGLLIQQFRNQQIRVRVRVRSLHTFKLDTTACLMDGIRAALTWKNFCCYREDEEMTLLFNTMQWSGKRNGFLTMWWETVMQISISVMLKRNFGGNIRIWECDKNILSIMVLSFQQVKNTLYMYNIQDFIFYFNRIDL